MLLFISIMFVSSLDVYGATPKDTCRNLSERIRDVLRNDYEVFCSDPLLDSEREMLRMGLFTKNGYISTDANGRCISILISAWTERCETYERQRTRVQLEFDGEVEEGLVVCPCSYIRTENDWCADLLAMINRYVA